MTDIRLVSIYKKAFAPAAVFFAILLAGTLLFGHGLTSHAVREFNTFKAAKKGIMLYDRLVTTGRLNKSWEDDLENIKVSLLGRGPQNEFVVRFSRTTGEPRSVYIFFSEKGEYRGSNFTGK